MKLRYILLLIGAVLMALVAVGVGVLPSMTLKWGLVRGFTELGFANPRLEDVRVNLWNGTLTLRGFKEGQGQNLALDELALELRYHPLVDSQLVVQSLKAKGLSLKGSVDDNQMLIDGVSLPRPQGGDDAASAQPPFGYAVEELLIEQSTLVLTHEGLTHHLEIDRLTLTDLRSWDPESTTHFGLVGRLDGAPVTIFGGAQLFGQGWAVALRLEVQEFNIGPMAALAGFKLRGKLSSDLIVNVGDGENGFYLNSAGRAKVDGARLQEGVIDLTSSGLIYDGVVNYDGYLSGDGSITASNIHMRHPDLTLNAREVSWWGSVRGAEVLNFTGGSDAMDVQLLVAGLDMQAGVSHLKAKEGSFDQKAKILHLTGDLVSRKSLLLAEQATASQESFSWNGSLWMNFAKPEDFFRTKATVTTKGTNLKLDGADIRLGEAKAVGELRHAVPDGVLLPVAGTLRLDAKNAEVDTPGVQLLRARNVKTNVHFDPVKRTQFDGFEATNVVLQKGVSPAYPARVEAQIVKGDGIALRRRGSFTARFMETHGGVVRVTRTHDGFLGLEAYMGDATDPTGEPRRLVVNEFRTLKGTRLEFEDRTTANPVSTWLRDVELVLGRFDTRAPDKPTPYTLKSIIGSAGRLDVSGVVLPLAEQIGGTVMGSIRAMELPSLSPYSEANFGVALDTGQLDVDLDIKALNGVLNGLVALKLAHVTVSEADAELVAKANTPLSVDTILSLLDDGDGRIRLEIPLSGDLSNPQFDLSQAINKAIGGAVEATMVTTFKLLFPLAHLWDLLTMEAKVTMPSLGFYGGEARPNHEHDLVMAEVVKVMQNRPKGDLRICGIATWEHDWPARLNPDSFLVQLAKSTGLDLDTPEPNKAALERLASTRSHFVREALVARGLPLDRMFICRPRVFETGIPRVELLF